MASRLEVENTNLLPQAGPDGENPTSLQKAERDEDLTAPIRKADYEILAELRYAVRKFLRFSELTAAEQGATPQQYQALQAIQGYPGRDWMTLTELTERLQLKHHSIVGLVDRMVARGWIKRDAVPGNRRKVALRLTPEGLQLLETLTAPHLAEWRRIAPDLQQVLERLTAQSS